MRQIGTLPTKSEASRFADYLLTQGVEVQAEQNSEGWLIWVRDENQLEEARRELAQFQKNPSDDRYDAAVQKASSIRREDQARREQVRRNTHEMRDRWNRPLMQRRPVTMMLIAVSVFVFILSNMGNNWSVLGYLSYDRVVVGENGMTTFLRNNYYAPLQSLQPWRAITPIFIHFGVLHLVFNCYMLFLLGGMVEERRSSWLLGFLVLTVAIISNVVQYGMTGSPLFGGMSGVVYGVFGYLWMKSQFDPGSGFFLDTGTIVILLAWLFLAMAGVIPNVANGAHVGGLLTGMALGYAPLLLRGSKQ